MQSILMKMKKQRWIIEYTVVFGIFAVLVYSLNIIGGRSFIYTTEAGVGDGLVQHYNALMYYGEWLRKIIHNIFMEHSFEIPMWDFSIGLGGDVLNTLSFYVIGDPFAFFSVFVPTRYTELLYNILVIARLYSAGVAFYIYCRYHRYRESYILIGCMIYVFSFYSIVVSVLHPYYLNPLIYLPLILMGIDKILNGESAKNFILACWIAAVSNFYFFYMLSILMVLYAVIRYVSLYGRSFHISHLLRKFATCAVGYILGLILAAPVFIPAAMAVLESDRVGMNAYVPALYEPIYYVKLVIAFVNASADYYSALGYTVIGLWAVVMLFLGTKLKEKISLKVGCLIGGVFLCFPLFGHIMNGFSYVVNRWVWAFCFVIALVVVEMMPQLVSMKWKNYVWMSLTAVLFAACTFYFRAEGDADKLKSALAALFVMVVCLSAVILLCLFLQDYEKKRKLDTRKAKIYVNPAYSAFIGILAINIFFNMYSYYSDTSRGDIRNHGVCGEAYDLFMNSPIAVVADLEDAAEVRCDTGNIGTRELMVNSAMQYDVNGTAFYDVGVKTINNFAPISIAP